MRLQVMHLPAPPDEYPFALVIDQCDDPEAFLTAATGAAKEALGARGVLVFESEVEIA